MNGTLLHVTRQDVACFVLCVLIKIPCLTARYIIKIERRLYVWPLNMHASAELQPKAAGRSPRQTDAALSAKIV